DSPLGGADQPMVGIGGMHRDSRDASAHRPRAPCPPDLAAEDRGWANIDPRATRDWLRRRGQGGLRLFDLLKRAQLGAVWDFAQRIGPLLIAPPPALEVLFVDELRVVHPWVHGLLLLGSPVTRAQAH